MSTTKIKFALNILHLEERKERLQSFMEQTNQQTIPYRVWYGFRDKLPFKAISESHKQIVSVAKHTGKPFVIIAEDDFLLTSKQSWQTYIKNMPEEFDLYLGGASGGNVDEEKGTIEQFSGLFFYTVHARFYDAYLAADPMKNIDRWLGLTGMEEIEKLLGRKPVYKICYPMISITTDGFSDNAGKFVEHKNYFAPYKLLK